MRLSDRTHAGRVGKQSLIARAISPLAHMLCAAPVFAPCGARHPALRGCTARALPVRHRSLVWSCCRIDWGWTPHPESWVSCAPAVLRRAGLCPHLQTGCWGTLKTLGRFFRRRLPRPSAQPAGAGVASGAAPRQRLASRPMRSARSAGAT